MAVGGSGSSDSRENLFFIFYFFFSRENLNLGSDSANGDKSDLRYLWVDGD